MLKILLIMGGGALGALLRYVVSGWGQRIGTPVFPWGTLVVNLTGCMAIGLFGALFTGPLLVREEYRVALLVGLLGAFTTFSTFAWESAVMVNDGKLGLAMLNIFASNVLGLAAVWIGYRVARSIWGV